MDSHPWIAICAAHLLSLRPGMNAYDAVQHAVATMHHAGHLAPEIAAGRLAAQCAPASAPSEEQSARYRKVFGAG